MPKTPEQFQSIREERIKEIKNISLKLFALNGYHNTSISEITQAAKISKGLIYNYFESKQAILESIISDFVNIIWDYLDKNKDGVLEIDEFFYFIKKNFEIVKKNPELWKLYTVLSLQTEVFEILTKRVDEYSRKMGVILYNFFNKYFENPQEEMIFFSSVIKGALIQYITMPDNNFLKIIEKKVIDHYKKILKNK